MTTKASKALTATLAVSTALAAGYGMAPAVATAQGLVIEDIVVTARRIEEGLQSTPVAVSAFTATTIETRNLVDVRDLAAATPNLVFQMSGVNGSSQTPSVYLRGLGQSDTVLTADPAVGIYVDGVYVARNVGSILKLIDLERIEVLRGPQGTLFGKNTIGGAISLVSKKPEPEFDAMAEATGGSRTHVGGRFMLNLPVADNFYLRLSGLGNRQDGYVKLANYPGREFGDDKTLAVRGQARWLASDTFTVDLALDYTRTRNTGSPGILREVYPTALIPGIHNAIVSGNPASCLSPAGQAANPACFGPVQLPANPKIADDIFYDRDLNIIDPVNAFDVFGASLTLDWDMDFATLQSISSYRGLRSDYSADGGHVGFLIIQSNADRQDSDQFSQEFQLSGQALSDRLKWLTGAYYFYEKSISEVHVLSPFALALPFNSYPILTDNRQPTSTDNLAFYGQATYDITDWLHLTAGGRWTYEKKTSTLILLPQIPGGLSGRLTTKKFTPMVSLSADLNDDAMVYVSFAEGFRSGSFPPRIIGQVATLPAHGPETATTFEAGIKADLLGKRLRTNLALFTTKFEDFHAFGNLPNVVPPFGTIINAGDARIKGVELEAQAAITENFQIDGSLSYLTNKLTRVDPTVNVSGIPVTLDKKMPFAPEWKAAGGVTWTLPLANGSYIRTRADIAYTDMMFFSLANIPEGAQSSTVLVNGNITYTLADEHLQLVVGVRNLTDKFYFTQSGADFQTSGTATGNLAEPRTFYGTLRWRY